LKNFPGVILPDPLKRGGEGDAYSFLGGMDAPVKQHSEICAIYRNENTIKIDNILFPDMYGSRLQKEFRRFNFLHSDGHVPFSFLQISSIKIN
jgi:hypothetical protein